VLPGSGSPTAAQADQTSPSARPRIVAVTPPPHVLRRQGAQPLSGTIYDATGAVIPGVQVTLVDANENRWVATSNASGRFQLPAVSPGKYIFEARVVGFRSLRQEFELRDSRDWERAVTLQVGELSERQRHPSSQ
jgi:hypothetical protein